MIYPGKTIDEGTVVDESVVWESPSQRQVFSDSGVRGIVNVDMTPGAHRPPRGRLRHDPAQGRHGHASDATTRAPPGRSTGHSPAPSRRRASTSATCAP